MPKHTEETKNPPKSNDASSNKSKPRTPSPAAAKPGSNRFFICKPNEKKSRSLAPINEAEIVVRTPQKVRRRSPVRWTNNTK